MLLEPCHLQVLVELPLGVRQVSHITRGSREIPYLSLRTPSIGMHHGQTRRVIHPVSRVIQSTLLLSPQ